MSISTLKTFRTAAAIVALAASFTIIGAAQAQIGQLPTRDGMPTLAPLIDKVAPAVVNIQVKTKIDIQDNPLFNDPQFRRFFDIPENMPRQRERQSGGSGVIIDAKKGYVITNHHVVDGASEVAVRLSDEREFEAKVIGSDEGTDVALLQIEANDLKALTFGNSDTLKVGDFVIAIGSPFGLAQSVTSGIISALGRSNLRIEGYEDFIQTDAAINPGNSGGALINLKGELVGMNTAILSGRTGGNVGIGFAIPTAMIASVKDQLIEFGEVRRGRIGIEIADLTPDLAETLGTNKTEGALISRVQRGTPGEEAGLQSEDIVISMDGKPIKNAADLRNRVSLTQFGTAVKLTIIRDGKEKEVKVTLGKMPKEEEVAEIEDRPTLQGASFSDDDGVVVTEVERNSPAWQIGLRQNDQIAAVNRKPVTTMKEFRDALDGSKQAALSVKRGDESLFLIIR